MGRYPKIAVAWVPYTPARRTFFTTAQGLAMAPCGTDNRSKRDRDAWEHAFDREYRTMIHKRRALRMVMTPAKLKVRHA